LSLLALYSGKDILVIKKLDLVLEDLRKDPELRRHIITEQKAYLMVDRACRRLVKKGFLQETDCPPPEENLDIAIARFAKILRKEFPSEWKEIKVTWRKGEAPK